MRFLVFPYDSSTLMGSLKYSLRINIDLVQNVVVREAQRKARLYTDGGFEEYEIARIVEIGKDTYYIVGKLLEQAKPDYKEPLKNQLEEVLT